MTIITRHSRPERTLSPCYLVYLAAAIDDYSKSIELEPTYARAYYERGLAYHSLDSLNYAIADYTMAIELNPKISRAYFNRGTANATVGDMVKACSDWEKAANLGFEDAAKMLMEFCK